MNPQLKPDFTAWFVMQCVIAAMKHPAFEDSNNHATLNWYKPLEEEASKSRLLARLIYKLPAGLQYKIGQLTTTTSRVRHFYFRKKEIEAQVRSLLDGGETSQVIVLGAGLDVLSLRLANEYKEVKFIEIDTEPSQTFKTSSFSLHNQKLPENVEFVEGDLRNPLADILKQAKSYSACAKTVWIAEGLLMFIPEQDVTRIFRAIKGLCDTDSHIIFTTLPSLKITSTMGYLIQNLFLNLENCQFKWAIPLDRISAFMENMGYKLTGQIAYEALQTKYMKQNFDGKNMAGENINIVRFLS